jgi:hypothetical protein
MSWFWLNMSLGLVFAAATAGIPLWVVLRRPGVGPARSAAPDATPQSRPVVTRMPAPVTRRPARRELAGTGAR